jgi:hypothetical protein
MFIFCKLYMMWWLILVPFVKLIIMEGRLKETPFGWSQHYGLVYNSFYNS